ncbi:MAG: DUF494 family protein [Chloroherpetonaceae bacterium]|jgi:hypothetical protein|nr:DUF494 family protein [bacterium]
MSKNILDKAVEIILEIAPELLRTNNLKKIDISKLESAGYTKIEVSYAITLLLNKNPKLSKQSRKKITKPQYIRVLNPYERKMFSNEAYRDFMTMRALGVWDEEGLDEIFDQIIIFHGGGVNRDEFREILCGFLVSDDFPLDGKGPKSKVRENVRIQ